jgi:hypothetical protein
MKEPETAARDYGERNDERYEAQSMHMWHYRTGDAV